jgi:protein-arginine kinase activator protein McsA
MEWSFMESPEPSDPRPPKVFLTKVIGGKTFHAEVSKAATPPELLEGEGYALLEEGEDLGRVRRRITVECPVCGCSQERFEQTGRFGCPQCYQTFGGLVPGLLQRMHSGLHHVGKIPAGQKTEEVAAARRSHLQEELDEAIEREDYEEAARLRDEIRLWASAPESGS